jgi:hypothetical protein
LKKSDKGKNYIDIADFIEGHVTVLSTKHATNNTVRWEHRAISNAKRTLLGIFHFVNGCNLQLHFDEFCYKLNRRNFGSLLFDRLIVAIKSVKCIQTG